MSTFTKYLIVILIGLILLLTFTYSTDYINISLPISFSSNPFTFNSEKQNNSSESQVHPKEIKHSKKLDNSSHSDEKHHQKSKKDKDSKETNNLKSQDNNKFFGLNMPKSVPFSLDYLSKEDQNEKTSEQNKNFSFEKFLNNSDVEQSNVVEEDINNFLIDTNFTTNESENIDNKLFIQTDDYQMTENTHNVITNALRNI